ncbi:MAG: ABC transporter ATP-binding protein [Thermoleophilia bacterium]|nr:ABC transporter ATP-binding protein [Thermoleophilia bacterium]
MGTRPVGHGHVGGLISRLDHDEDEPRGTRRPRRNVRRLVPYFRPYRGRVILTVVLMLLVTAAGLAGPALAQIAIDSGISVGSVTALAVIVTVFVVIGLIGLVAGYWQSYLSSWVGERVLLDLRRQVFRHMMRLDLGHHERTPTGRSVSRLTSDIEAVHQLVVEGATSLVINGLSLIGVVCILIAYDWKLAIAALIIFPILAVGTAWFRVTAAKAYRLTRERVAVVLTVLQETLSGVRVVQAHGRQDEVRRRFRDANREYREANMTTVTVSGIYFPAVELLAALGTALILWYGGNRVLSTDLSVGVMVAFIGYLSAFFDPIQQLSQLFNTFQSAMAALEKIFGVLETDPAVTDRADAVDLPAVPGAIDLDGVSFGYGRDYVIRDVHLHIAPGATVALVGATGAGKSTIAKLIARLYDPDEGTVTVGGIDLRGVREESLRAQMGIVPQEGHLFSTTIAENVRFAFPAATDEDVRRALETVGALEFVDGLPDGIHTDVQERGARLSSGQRQLICFARALVADPQLIILDEATSSVDIGTEKRIEDALDRLLSGRTAVIIAHRLSTIRRADRIVVVADGRIADQGSHDELMSRDGIYTSLYRDWESATA